MSPAVGKRRTDRGGRGRPSVSKLRYQPRPHLTIRIQDIDFDALLDIGSEGTFMDSGTARRLQDRGFLIQSADKRVRLANGTMTAITQIMTVPIEILGRQITHEIQIMPTLGVEILVGVNLWARTRFFIPPPPIVSYIGSSDAFVATPRSESRVKNTELHRFLEEELSQFEGVRGPTDRIQHVIRVTIPYSIKQRYRPRNPTMQAVIDAEVDKMEKAGIIEPSQSAWSSLVVVVRKKDRRLRFCIDFRRVNEVTERDAYPLPQIITTLDKLRSARFLSTLDLQDGYWQVPLSPESRPVTAFTVPGRGLMQFRVMPFGLHSAPVTFQRLLDTILGPELEPRVFVYLDDIIIGTATLEEHIATLREVFRRLREARLKLNPDKCKFCVSQIKYLGHLVTPDGIRTDPDKTAAITDWPEPVTVKQVRQFLGVASWYRRFVPSFATIAAPLTGLTRKRVKWSWGTNNGWLSQT